MRSARRFPFGHEPPPREARGAVAEQVTMPLAGFVPPARALPFEVPAPVSRGEPQQRHARAPLLLLIALVLFLFDVAALWLALVHGGR